MEKPKLTREQAFDIWQEMANHPNVFTQEKTSGPSLQINFKTHDDYTYDLTFTLMDGNNIVLHAILRKKQEVNSRYTLFMSDTIIHDITEDEYINLAGSFYNAHQPKPLSYEEMKLALKQ